jgi:hypothetical protein
MSADSRASAFLEQRARLKRWASTTGVASANTIVNDLAEIWAAAHAIITAIEALPADREHSGGARLIEIQTSLYEELLDHAASLKAPLQVAVDEVYERG